MTDDPRRRHLSAEEAAELRRQARERRGYVAPSGGGERGRGRGREASDARPDDPRNRDAEPYDARQAYEERRARRERRTGARPVVDGRPETRAETRLGPAVAAGREPYGDEPHDDRRVDRRERRPRSRRRFRIRPLRTLAVIVALLLTLAVVLGLWADSKLQRIDALGGYDDRPKQTPGTVTLIVGTDSREGLTADQQSRLATGSESDAGGKRTDTMMMAYSPDDGGPTLLVSLPRDLLVSIPGYGENKLNAAYAYGGAPLLAQTLERQSGVRIDHYAEIGFGGFAGIVDAVDGVDVCVDQPIDDPDAGINLPSGCQTLDGPKALGFVRTRHTFADQDLQRVRNQRQFLGALVSKITSPGVMLNPFTVMPVFDNLTKAVTVDSGDHIWGLLPVLWDLKEDPKTVTVPYDGMEDGDVGSYLVWGPSTREFFDALKRGDSPPDPPPPPG